MLQPTPNSIITCPACGAASQEEMPTDACIYFYECKGCRKLLRPNAGDCCVFCSYGSVKCPPVQLETGCCASPGSRFRVRQFEEKDRSVLESIYRECRSEAEWLPPAVRERSDFSRDTQGEALLVAIGSNDEPQGFVSVWEQEAFIHHLYVRSGSRKRGLGTQLLEALNPRLPRPWKLKCVRANDGALAFYLGHGWREISSGDGEDGPYAVLECL